MALHVVAICGGLVVLAVASDVFVVGAARLSSILGVPEVVVGTVVIGFGTSLPELFTSALSAGEGSTGIAIGSVVGSNTFNATLVIGAASLIASPSVSSRILHREAPVSLAAVVLFGGLILTTLTRYSGMVLLVAAAVALAVLLHGAFPLKRPAASSSEPRGPDGEAPADDEVSREVQSGYLGGRTPHLAGECARTALGLAATLGGAQLLVWGALGIATSSGVDQGVIGFTLVAAGTSLPELVTAIQASRRGRTDLVIGNVLGSNLFNALVVAGCAALVRPGKVPGDVAHVPNLIMVVSMLALTAWMATGRRLRRAEGVAMMLTYGLSVALSVT